jgi:hypothetical protein
VRPAHRSLVALLGLLVPACTPDLEAVTVTPLTSPPGDAGASALGIELREIGRASCRERVCSVV